MLVKPRAWEPGARVAVVAPASPFDREAFERGTDELRDLGLDPVYESDVFTRRGYVAGGPGVRSHALRRAWQDASVTGLIGARGGYGSMQVLPFLDREEVVAARKAFVGYSDLTALLIYLTTTCGLVAFHGPTVAGPLSGGSTGYDRESFRRCLMDRDPPGELVGPTLETIRPGEATGMLLGGTLTQILASLGTPYAFAPPAGYVLLVDEVGERPYRIDRLFTQLRQSGLLARAAGVVVGQLPRCDEPTGQPTARSVVADLLGDFPGPVLFGFPTGHTTGPPVTVPLGVPARVVGGSRPRVVIEEASVV